MALGYNLVGLVHTNAHKFNPMKNYENLGAVTAHFNKNTLLAQVDAQTSLLKQQEQEFYKMIFPGFSGTYKDFVLQIRNTILPGDEDIFNKFANFDSDISLQRKIIDDLQINVDSQGYAIDDMGRNILGKVGNKKNQPKVNRKVPGRFIKDGKVMSARTIRGKLSAFEKEDFNQIMNFQIKFVGQKSGKETQKIAEFDLGPLVDKALKQATDSRIIPILVDEIIEEMERVKKTFPQQNRYEVPNPHAVLSYLKGPLKQKIFDGLSLEQNTTQEEVDFAYLWAFEQGRQNRGFDNTKKYQEQRIYNLLLTMSAGCSPKFSRALNNVWFSNYQNKWEHIHFADSNIPGFLGEFAGAVLFAYLTDGNGISPSIVGQQTYKSLVEELNWGEQMRSDIRVGNFGIQAKNWKESSLSNFEISINLHPIQILHRLAGLINTSLTEELSTFFANLAFSDEAVNEYEKNPSPIIKFLSNFFPYIANFISNDKSNDLGTNFLDTSPFWLLGGKALVPASIILEEMMELLGEEFEAISRGQKLSNMILDISSDPAHQETEWKEGNIYIPNEYWVHDTRLHAWAGKKKGYNYEIANWIPTSENKPEFNRMLVSKRVSTHIHFKPLKLQSLQNKLLSELSFI